MRRRQVGLKTILKAGRLRHHQQQQPRLSTHRTTLQTHSIQPQPNPRRQKERGVSQLNAETHRGLPLPRKEERKALQDQSQTSVAELAEGPLLYPLSQQHLRGGVGLPQRTRRPRPRRDRPHVHCVEHHGGRVLHALLARRRLLLPTQRIDEAIRQLGLVIKYIWTTYTKQYLAVSQKGLEIVEKQPERV